MSDRVAGNAVGAALEDDKFGFSLPYKTFQLFPCLKEEFISGVSGGGKVEFSSCG